MRDRQTIKRIADNYKPPEYSHESVVRALQLELLLDIREMLIEITIHYVDEGEQSGS